MSFCSHIDQPIFTTTSTGWKICVFPDRIEFGKGIIPATMLRSVRVEHGLVSVVTVVFSVSAPLSLPVAYDEADKLIAAIRSILPRRSFNFESDELFT